jgi:PAS domain S-box-containing protein
MHRKTQLFIILPIITVATIILVFHLSISEHPSAIFFPVAFTIITLSGIFLGVFYLRNTRPLNIIESALNMQDASQLKHLRTAKGRFAQLAELIAQSFDQRAQLYAEIAERKKTETKLADQEKRYRDLFDTAPDAIISVSRDGTLLLCNQASRKLLAIPPSAQFSTKNLADLFADELPETVTSLLTLPDDQLHPVTIECTVKKYAGDLLTAELRFIPFHIGETPPIFLLYLRDLTGQKEAEAEKQRMEEQFQIVYKMEAIGQLAGGIAHEYNNILGAISGYADLIRHRYTEDERLMKYAGMILSASQRASDLTRKLLIFARKNRLNLADFDARQALEEAIDLLRQSLDKSITITFHDLAPQSFIYGDITHFQNAIMNLALNSRDAMPSGGKLTFRSAVVEIDRSVMHRRDFPIAPGEYFSVSIGDSGCGMNQEVLDHVFEPFFTTKDIGKGTGLGLASVYGTVKSHHGFIDVQSTPDEGTLFTLYFPLVSPVPLTLTGSPQQDFTGKGNILFIDDESILRDAVREMLTLTGFTVTTGVDGENALSIFSADPDRFILIILDMKMPGMSGLECFRKMKEIKPEVRVLLSTGYSLEEDKQAIINEGIAGIIQKPYVSAQLAQAVKAALSSEST